MTFTFDYLRHERIGLPESIYCEGKDLEALTELLRELSGKQEHPVLLTRLHPEKFEKLPEDIRKRLNYDAVSETAFLNGTRPPVKCVSVAVVLAGTSDRRIALEASRTLHYLGVDNRVFPESGVAGIWRLEKHLEEINAHDAVIVVAGMDAALASVMGGLTAKPIIAVPTSVGYGVAESGRTALHAMLTSCAPGVTVVNIDNGYGAACACFRIVNC